MGSVIKECIKEWKRDGGIVKRSPKVGGAKYSQKPDDLEQINEAEAEKENTQKLTSQRASQAEIAPDQVNLAINEPEE